MKDRDIEEIKKILHKFFLSFFSIYENKKTGKISSFDYNINNIIINHDGFYLIDPGMKLEQEMPKCWLIYLLCDLGLVNIHDESQYCKEFIKMQENDFIDKIKNIKTEMPEVKKIFGKTAFIPEYDINSIKNIKSEVY